MTDITLFSFFYNLKELRMASCIQSPAPEHGHYRMVSNKQLKVQDKSVNIC